VRLGAWALIVLLGAGCIAGPTVAPPPDLAGVLETPDGVVGLFRDANGVHLVLGNDDTGGQHDGANGESLPTVHLFSLGGQTGRTYNSFVFGLAPPGAVTVHLAGLDGIGGTVDGGLYVIALRDKDILPKNVVWSFQAPSGAVIAEGSNITP
jgi:hypothetical protein